MPNPVVPTLSSFGWVNSPAVKADVLMAHFFEANKSQTNLYGPNVSSLQWLIQQKGNDPNALASAVESALSAYLGRYFDGASISVQALLENPDTDQSRYSLRVQGTITAEGKEYSLEKLLELNDGKFKLFAELNN
jgi:hypothetical protein